MHTLLKSYSTIRLQPIALRARMFPGKWLIKLLAPTNELHRVHSSYSVDMPSRMPVAWTAFLINCQCMERLGQVKNLRF